MRPRPVPVTLPRARFMVDQDDRLTVTVDGRPWQPSTIGSAPVSAATGLLGRSDVPRAQEQMAEELDTPVLVQIVDDGQVYEPYFVVPDSFQPIKPNSPSGPADGKTGAVARSGLETSPGGGGGFAPGEAVAVVMVVGRTVADEHGTVGFRLPPALRDRTRALLVQGQVSGTTVPYDDLAQQSVPARTARAPGSSSAADPVRPVVGVRDLGVPLMSDHRPVPAPATHPTPTTPNVPDAGLGAL